MTDGSDRLWVYWMDKPPNPSISVEIRRGPNGVIEVVTPMDLPPEFNIHDLFWRLPTPKRMR